MKPASARLPVSSIRRSRPTRASISAHSSPVRPSFQRIAGRSTRSLVVEHDEAVHLAREADRPVRAAARERGLGRAPPVLGILLGPARAAASRAGTASSALASTSPSGAIATRLDAASCRRRVPTSASVTTPSGPARPGCPNGSRQVKRGRPTSSVPSRVATPRRLEPRPRAPSRSSTTRQKCGLSARRLVEQHQVQLEVAADAVPDERATGRASAARRAPRGRAVRRRTPARAPPRPAGSRSRRAAASLPRSLRAHAPSAA